LEHDIEWYNEVKKEIINLPVELYYRPPIKSKIITHSSVLPNNDFSSYINFISELDKKYNLIIVDGRARVLCFQKSLKYVNLGGHIILHDSEREEYSICWKMATRNRFKIWEILEKRNTLICQKY